MSESALCEVYLGNPSLNINDYYNVRTTLGKAFNDASANPTKLILPVSRRALAFFCFLHEVLKAIGTRTILRAERKKEKRNTFTLTPPFDSAKTP